MSDYVYLYGFVPSDASPPAQLNGVGGRSVELVQLGAIKGAVGRVPADVYDPAVIETRLQDLSWVAEQGVAHESVVAWFVDHSQILPVPLFTMYSSDAALQQELGARGGAIERELRRLNNKREWDVKISFDERELEQHASALSPRLAELEKEALESAPGRRYLLQKKRADLLKNETRRAALNLANRTLESVARLAADNRTLPIPRTTDELPVILYAALLVARTSENEIIGELEKHAEDLKSKGMALVFSGPWAPYRFTGDHDGSAADAE